MKTNNQKYILEIRGKGLSKLRDYDLSEKIAVALENTDIPLSCYVHVEKMESGK